MTVKSYYCEDCQETIEYDYESFNSYIDWRGMVYRRIILKCGHTILEATTRGFK